MALRLSLRRPSTPSGVLYAVSATLLAGSLIALATAAPGRADAPGSDWGSNGVMAPTGSAVTVDWNNGGSTPSYDQVPRDSSQVLPHTGGKTYADIPSAVNQTVQNDFGGLQLTVSQTTGLRHQGVDLTVTGARAVTGSGQQKPNALLVMQCWGAVGQTSPDPADCQDGAGVVDGSSFVQRRFSGADNTTGFVAGTDFKAETTVNLYGQLIGSGMTFTAAVTASVFVPSGEQNLASGAKGTVKLLDPNLKVVGSGTVVNGIATIPLANPAYSIADYTAEYVATPAENFFSSVRSSPAANIAYRAPTAPGIGTATSPSLTATIPFTAVDGTTVPMTSIGSYFTQTTTNEIGALLLPDSASGTASRTFEMQTGAESPGLGCGKRTDEVSTSTCWLVAVPFDATLPASYQLGVVSPLTPSLWAQRLQVRLGFADVTTFCTGSTSHELSIGSELLTDAMNSWIPAICTAGKVDLSYVQSTDGQARSQYEQKSAGLIFTSAPTDDSGGTSTLYAPAGLTALTISVLAVDGGTRTPVTGIRLNARLVAKLLTESYRNQIDPGDALPAKDIPWYSTLPASLVSDPEFLALNPQLSSNAVISGSDLIVTVAGTDATDALWNWIDSDADARAFLDGCPDTASPVAGQPSAINPFYSTRSYAECASEPGVDTAALDATATSEISAQSAANPNGTVLPATFVYSKPSYPPTTAAFPQPGYYERPPASTATGATPLTLADLHPRESTMQAVAADVFRGQEKSLNVYCTDMAACPGTNVVPPGVWINTTRPNFGSGILGLTDGTAAASDLLPTALLCDDSGVDCVGANNASLTAATATFTASSTTPGFFDAPKTPSWATGAYPLTIPVYAEIDTKGLSTTDATADAAILSYISGAGQTQGYDVGDLPPGMAPLTTTLLAQDAAAVTTLKAIAAATPAATTTPTPNADAATTPASNTATGPGAPAPVADQVPPVNTPGSGSSAPVSNTTAQPTATPAVALGL
ncbi:MAG: hypothetical protein FWE71_16765, partial [Nocardioidaceae bacterium]|nr:hypothetical protein [Nocardioidaceae bacterium]